MDCRIFWLVPVRPVDIIFGFDGQTFSARAKLTILVRGRQYLVSDDGNGWEDILAVTARRLGLLQWNGLGFDSVWRLEGTGGESACLPWLM